MTALQAFTNHEFGTIRTITSGGQILFCGRDVANALGYQDPANAVKLHCKGVVNYHPLATPGGVQQVRFISEGDLYRLIVTSKLPAAQKFEAWVLDEVLPSIRRHGMYVIDELLADDEFLEQAFATMHGEIALLEGGGGSELDADVTQLHRSLTDGRVGRGRGASRHGAVRFFSQPGEMGDSAHWSVTFL